MDNLYTEKVTQKQPKDCTKSWMAQPEIGENFKDNSTTGSQVMKES